MKISISVHDSPILKSITNNNSTGSSNIEEQIQTLEIKKETLEYELNELKKEASKKNNQETIAKLEKQLLKVNIKLQKLKLLKERKEDNKNSLDKRDIVDIKDNIPAKVANLKSYGNKNQKINQEEKTKITNTSS